MPRRRIWLWLLPLLLACGETPDDPLAREVLVRVRTVGVDENRTPVVFLEEQGGPRILPIWIGPAEARSIATQLRGEPSPRPNFHDMATRVLRHLEGEVERVVVTQLLRGTYYAILHLRANGRSIEIDVRPSDGIAMALRNEAPILVRASVFEEAGHVLRGDEEGRPIALPAPHLQPAGRPQATRGLRL